MTTATEAAFALDRQLVARLAAGLPARVEQVDAVLAEDGSTVVNYVYFADCPDHDCLVLSYDWQGTAQDFDRNAAARRLLHDDTETAH